jgi:hypothetical protein
MSTRTTKNKISAIIKERTGMDIKIYTGYGYFHFYSDDEPTALRLARWYTTSVDVNGLWVFSNEGWADEFMRLMESGE